MGCKIAMQNSLRKMTASIFRNAYFVYSGRPGNHTYI
jgi:hypothetical protein